MKIYLKCIVVINLIIVTIALFYPYRFERTYYSVESIKDFYQQDRGTNGFTTLFLGDSTVAFGIQPKLLDNAYSLALPSSTNVNVWIELDRYLKQYKMPKCLAYSTSYISENFTNGFLGKHASARVYTWSDYRKVFIEASAAGQQPLSDMSHVQYAARMFYLMYFDYSAYSQAKLRSVLTPWTELAQRFDRARAQAIESKGYLSSTRFGQTMFSDRQNYLLEPFKTFPLDDFYFAKIVERVRSERGKFLFIEMPIFNPQHDSRIEAYNSAHLNHIRTSLVGIPDAKIIHVDVALDERDFFDANHLNLEGSEKFTTALRKTLESECGQI